MQRLLGPGDRTRTMGWLFALSLALRLVVFAAVAAGDVPLVYDEQGYLVRARAYVGVASALARLEPPSQADRARAYGQGRWPPVHPLLLAAALSIRDRVAAARLLMVLVSAVTTVLVYRLSLRLSSPRAARAAACTHALYPSFVAYSHYLWSETTFGLLLVATLLLAVAMVAEGKLGRRWALAVATGSTLGLAVLSRVSAAPLLVVIPVWLAVTLRRRQRGWMAAAATCLVSLAVLAPWQLTLVEKERRPVLLSTLGGFNLALGNNPWVPAGYGSSWGHPLRVQRLHEELQARAARRSVTWEATAAGLAIEEIRTHPLAAVRRSVERLRMLFSPDHFPLRHIYRCIYPPLPPAVAAALALLVVLGYLGLGLAALLGLLAGGEGLRHRGLLVAVLAAGMLPPALSIGMSRLHQPLLVVGLPAAGVALAGLLTPSSLRVNRWTALACLAWLAVVGSSMPLVAKTHLEPSTYYARTASLLGRWLGFPPRCSDQLQLRRSGDGDGDLLVEPASPGVRFRDGSLQLRWPASGRRRRLLVDLVAESPRAPILLALRSAGSGAEVRIAPIRVESWRRWTPTGLPGVEVRWLGGGPAAE